MASTQLYIDTAKIENETQLTFQEHKVQELITKQISLEYNLNDIFLILAVLISLGNMILVMIQNQISISSINNDTNTKKEKSSFLITIVILIASIIFGCYANYQESQDEALIQSQINSTILSINTYKTSKAQLEELQNLKASAPKCMCPTTKVQKPCETKIQGIKPCKN